MILGKGGFGQVSIFNDPNRGKVAIKRGKRVNQQFDLLSKQYIKHPNIVQIYDFIDNGFTMQIFSFENGWIDLKHFLKEINDLKILAKRIPELVNVVEFLHEKNIAHRDIKPENIFIQLNQKLKYGLKLIDFGSACFTDICNDLIGTFIYSSPEIFKLASQNNVNIKLPFKFVEKQDLWSLGLVIYNCVHKNYLPFNYYNFYSSYAIDYYNFYTKYDGIPTVSYFENLEDKIVYIKNFKYTIEINNLNFLKLVQSSLYSRMNYKNYLKINLDERIIPKKRINNQEIFQNNIYEKSLILEKESKEIYTKLRQKRQQDYKKKTDEISALRILWRKNPDWNSFIDIETKKFKVDKNDLFIFLIKNPNNIDIFWDDIIKTTRAKRQSYFTKLYRKIIPRIDLPKDYRLSETINAKQKIFSLK